MVRSCNMSTGCNCPAFIEEWGRYLKQQNQRLLRERGEYSWQLLKSREKAGGRFLWIIMCQSGKVRRFSGSEIKAIGCIADAFGNADMKIFLVIKFCLPSPKVVVAGIDVVLKKKAVSASKGGIDWPPWNQPAD